MDWDNPICYLSFPPDPTSKDAAASLRMALDALGIEVLPPAVDPATSTTTTMRPFHWLRQANLVVADITGDSSWVAYEAGAALALNKQVMLVAHDANSSSPLESEIARAVVYEIAGTGELAKLVHRRLPGTG